MTGRLEELLGKNGGPLVEQAKLLIRCERWSGIAVLDLLIRRLGVSQPDLLGELRPIFGETKNNGYELQKRKGRIQELISPKSSSISMPSGVYEDLLIAIGMSTDLIGSLEIIQDLLNQVSGDRRGFRLLGQLANLMITTSVPQMARYQCFSQGEFGNAERTIQYGMVSLARTLLTILKSCPTWLEPLPLEIFLALTWTVRELLVMIYREKIRDYLKPSDKDVLADGPRTPTRFFLFERTRGLHQDEPEFVPVAKVWETFEAQFGFPEGKLRKMNSDPQVLTGHLGEWLSQAVMAEITS